MKLGEKMYGGYAGATMGGVSFMIELEAPEGRFEKIQSNEKYALNLVVSCEEDRALRTAVCAYSEDEKGERSYWGLDDDNEEENALTKEEMKIVYQLLNQAGIIEKAEQVIQEYNRLCEMYFDETKSVGLYEIKKDRTLEDIIEQGRRIDEYRKEQDGLLSEMKALEYFEVKLN